jgi:hypothetical protein
MGNRGKMLFLHLVVQEAFSEEIENIALGHNASVIYILKCSSNKRKCCLHRFPRAWWLNDIMLLSFASSSVHKITGNVACVVFHLVHGRRAT